MKQQNKTHHIRHVFAGNKNGEHMTYGQIKALDFPDESRVLSIGWHEMEPSIMSMGDEDPRNVPYLDIRYEKPETDGEYEQRIKEDEVRKKATKEREYEVYLRVKSGLDLEKATK